MKFLTMIFLALLLMLFCRNVRTWPQTREGLLRQTASLGSIIRCCGDIAWLLPDLHRFGFTLAIPFPYLSKASASMQSSRPPGLPVLSRTFTTSITQKRDLKALCLPAK